MSLESSEYDARPCFAEDMINHPPHYAGHPSGVEAIDICEHFNFSLGCAIKYIWRHDKKGTPVEDLQKAIFYLEREIRLISQAKDGS